MLYLYILLIAAVLGLSYMWFEAGFLEVKKIYLSNKESNLKVLFLTDIHINLLRVSPYRIIKVIDAEEPDFIIMSGDYISRPRHIPKFLDFLDVIKSNNSQIFLCLGNHDYEAFLKDKNGGLGKYVREIEGKGVTVLHNRTVCYEKNLKKYNITGISDYRRGGHDTDEALKFCHKDASSNIAFSHNPDIVLEIPKGKVDYLFCGHFHGGQIWLPFNLEFKVLRHERLCKRGIRRGLHRINGINVYISRGLGNVLFPLRFLSRPEVTLFYIP